MATVCLSFRQALRHNFRLRKFTSVSAASEAGQEKNIAIAPIPVAEKDPQLLTRELNFLPKSIQPRAAWIENLDTLEEEKRGLINLHPEVWASMPRTDIIARNIHWQRTYKYVDYRWTPTRAEKFGGGRKPWPQKGLGKARHGSVRSPLFLNGGICHGPRGPTSYFYMLPFFARVLGLTSTLSVKLTQDDLHIVDSLDIPTDEPQFLEDLVSERGWGLSVLFVDVPDLMPRNISVACDKIKHMNLMPAYGLNVYSMLKHETLVLTSAAVKHIEDKLLFALHRSDEREKTKKFMLNQQ